MRSGKNEVTVPVYPLCLLLGVGTPQQKYQVMLLRIQLFDDF